MSAFETRETKVKNCMQFRSSFSSFAFSGDPTDAPAMPAVETLFRGEFLTPNKAKLLQPLRDAGDRTRYG